MSDYAFEIQQAGPGRSRIGRLRVGGREIITPAFMPCASRAVVRACSPDDLQAVGIEIIVCNTVHLGLRPGPEVVAEAGGLHRFMNWPGLIATDSGGFQAYSLSASQPTAHGLRLRSPVDGSIIDFTPELSVEIQQSLGADIAVALDICPPFPSTHAAVRQAVQRTLEWAERCLKAHRREGQWLWGVVQGGVYPDLRRLSAQATARMGFTGFGIGGLSVGESRRQMLRALSVAVEHLPTQAPKWVMGVGTPRDIVGCVMLGADLFDCVLPTRMARHGSVLTSEGPLKINNARYRNDPRPLDRECDCVACRNYSRAYLHYLLRIEEATAWRLLSLHNLRYYARLMQRIRSAIESGGLQDLLDSLPCWTTRDGEAAD